VLRIRTIFVRIQIQLSKILDPDQNKFSAEFYLDFMGSKNYIHELKS
jgi:hypothetical protein